MPLMRKGERNWESGASGGGGACLGVWDVYCYGFRVVGCWGEVFFCFGFQDKEERGKENWWRERFFSRPFLEES